MLWFLEVFWMKLKIIEISNTWIIPEMSLPDQGPMDSFVYQRKIQWFRQNWIILTQSRQDAKKYFASLATWGETFFFQT